MNNEENTKGQIRLVIMGREIFSFNYGFTITAGFVAVVAATIFEISRFIA